MTAPHFDQSPNLAPTGVIQNPGIGGIIGGGLTNLAQFLMAQHQQQQDEAARQQQLGMEQQRVDLERSGQSFMQSQAKAKTDAADAATAETNRQAPIFGQAARNMQPTPAQT